MKNKGSFQGSKKIQSNNKYIKYIKYINIKLFYLSVW